MLLQIGSDSAFSREVLQGLTEAVAGGLDWQLRQVDVLATVETELRAWQPDGMISLLWQPRQRVLARRLGMEVVRLSQNEDAPSEPSVLVDEESLAGMALGYLADLGLRDCCWSAFSGAKYMNLRWRSFQAAAVNRGVRVTRQYWGPHAEDNNLDLEFRRQDDIVDWLRALPVPCGIWAVSDQHALTLARIAKLAGRILGDDIFLLGCDDDELLCDMHRPAISSIRTPGRAIGNRAVAMLDALMAGRQLRQPVVRLAPEGISERASTDRCLVGDHRLAEALRCIEAEACSGLHVDRVAAVAGCSRRHLERLFTAAALGTPHARILRRRCDEAARLLRETRFDLTDVALRCGFSSAQRLIPAFKAHHGCTPGTYRARY